MASTVLFQRERLADKAMLTSFHCRSEHQEEVELDLRYKSLSVIAVQREPYPNSEPVLAVSACIVPHSDCCIIALSSATFGQEHLA